MKFPPIKTPQVKVTLINTIARLRTLTEIELYGPLSGREGTPGFVDADGQNTYMGDFSRVDKRPKKLAEKFLPPVVKRGTHDEDVNWYARTFTEILVSEGRLARGPDVRQEHRVHVVGRADEGTLLDSGTGGLGFTPFGAAVWWIAVKPCGNDGKLYCIDPESGAELWTALSWEADCSGCPVAFGEDIFVAGDKGELYQLDVASGTIMKQVQVPGVIFGSLATDSKRLFFITDDGFLHAYRVADLQAAWKAPIALYSDSTPAVDQGVVYLADQQGQARAVDAATGKVLWTTSLGDEFSRCPVVGPDKIVFGCNDGTLAVLNRPDGKLVWSRNRSRVVFNTSQCGWTTRFCFSAEVRRCWLNCPLARKVLGGFRGRSEPRRCCRRDSPCRKIRPFRSVITREDCSLSTGRPSPDIRRCR